MISDKVPIAQYIIFLLDDFVNRKNEIFCYFIISFVINRLSPSHLIKRSGSFHIAAMETGGKAKAD